MLAQPLVFTAKLPITTNGEKRLSRVALDKVLVIEHLPVPLHVSWHCLRECGLACGFAIGMSRKQMRISPGYDVYVLEDAEFDSRNLPVEYQTHPYWVQSNLHQLGHCGVAPTPSQQVVMEQSRGRTTAGLASCLICTSTENLRLCSRCKAAHYCSRECQLADWPLHKVGCKRS
jgi:hypothetical protein